MNSAVSNRFIVLLNKLKKDGIVKSYRHFAIQLDYLPQSLSEILKGRRDVTIELIRKSVEVFKFNPNYLFTGDGSLFTNNFNQKNNLNIDSNESIFIVCKQNFPKYFSEIIENKTLSSYPRMVIPNKNLLEDSHRAFELNDYNLDSQDKNQTFVCSYIHKKLWKEFFVNGQFLIIITKNAEIYLAKISIKEATREVTFNSFYDDKLFVKETDILEIWNPILKINDFTDQSEGFDNNLQNNTNIEEIAFYTKYNHSILKKLAEKI